MEFGLFTVVHVMHSNGTYFPAMLLIGRGDDHAVPRHEDPGLEVVDVAPQDGFRGGGDDELVGLPLDIQGAASPDDVLVIVYGVSLGDVLDGVAADSFGHIVAVAGGFGVLALCPMGDDFLEKAHGAAPFEK